MLSHPHRIFQVLQPKTLNCCRYSYIRKILGIPEDAAYLLTGEGAPRRAAPRARPGPPVSTGAGPTRSGGTRLEGEARPCRCPGRLVSGSAHLGLPSVGVRMAGIARA